MVQPIVVGFMTLCTPWMSNLGSKPWFAKKKNVCWVDECIVLLQANFAMAKSFDQSSWW